MGSARRPKQACVRRFVVAFPNLFALEGLAYCYIGQLVNALSMAEIQRAPLNSSKGLSVLSKICVCVCVL